MRTRRGACALLPCTLRAGAAWALGGLWRCIDAVVVVCASASSVYRVCAAWNAAHVREVCMGNAITGGALPKKANTTGLCLSLSGMQINWMCCMSRPLKAKNEPTLSMVGEFA